MNGKQAKRIAAIARRLNPGGTGFVNRTITKEERHPFLPKLMIQVQKTTTRCTGYRASYQGLKKAFLRVKSADRAMWLRALESMDLAPKET